MLGQLPSDQLAWKKKEQNSLSLTDHTALLLIKNGLAQLGDAWHVNTHTKQKRNDPIALRHATTHHDARKAPEASDMNLLANSSIFYLCLYLVSQFYFRVSNLPQHRFVFRKIYVGAKFHLRRARGNQPYYYPHLFIHELKYYKSCRIIIVFRLKDEPSKTSTVFNA